MVSTTISIYCRRRRRCCCCLADCWIFSISVSDQKEKESGRVVLEVFRTLSSGTCASQTLFRSKTRMFQPKIATKTIWIWMLLNAVFVIFFCPHFYLLSVVVFSLQITESSSCWFFSSFPYKKMVNYWFRGKGLQYFICTVQLLIQKASNRCTWLAVTFIFSIWIRLRFRFEATTTLKGTRQGPFFGTHISKLGSEHVRNSKC